MQILRLRECPSNIWDFNYMFGGMWSFEQMFHPWFIIKRSYVQFLSASYITQAFLNRHSPSCSYTRQTNPRNGDFCLEGQAFCAQDGEIRSNIHKAHCWMTNDHDQFLKEIMSPVEYLNSYTVKSVLSVHAQTVFKFLSCLIQDKN
jgi:hypothetical protein